LVSKSRTTLNAAAESNLTQGGNNKVTQTKPDTTNGRDTVSQAEGRDTASSGTGSAVHVGDIEDATSATDIENGKAGGHRKKVRPTHSGSVMHPLICQ
jgi:asparagine N-glycosylation enzyme membrane subunit Stt3